MSREPNDEKANMKTVIRWIRQNAHPLTTLDPQAPLTDLEPLGDIVRNATVVGLGGGTRSAHEFSTIQHRVLQFLVEQLGFRSLALDMDWTQGIQLDTYVRTGEGDPCGLLADAQPYLQTGEILDVVRWMRAYNKKHQDEPLRIVGVDVIEMQALAYDAVTDFVARTAPERLDELDAHYQLLRPNGSIEEHLDWYRNQDDTESYVDHARAAYDLVENLPPHDGHALAVQHARAVVGFYQYHALDSRADRRPMGYLEQRLAENTIWWHEYTRDKIVYWGASTHISNGNPRIVSFPPWPPSGDRNAGSYLREHFGRDYVSVGLTFHHGSLTSFHGSEPQLIPAPSPEFVDAVLARTSIDTYLLDMHADRSDTVQAWLDSPAKTRVVHPNYDPKDDAAYHMSGGSLTDWFDIIIHCQEVTPARFLE